MTSSSAKDGFRKAAIARRDAAHRESDDVAHALRAAWASINSAPAGRILAGYRPIGSEIDPQPILEMWSAAGGALALPVMQGEEQPLLFRKWADGQRLEQARFGVEEPGLDAPVCRPDVVLVPLVAADRGGQRMGYGKGFYDRTLNRLRKTGVLLSIGLAYSEQIVDSLPTEPHDERLDWLLTPGEAWRIDGGGQGGDNAQ